ncbi:NAD(P)H-dependent oxidoreductase subunit E [Neisseria meningitidis]|nr:NAD(P)H-dependent oxidoreductase subunit E [Neisseria meningitidis]
MKIVTDKTPKVDIHAILTPQEIDGIHHHIHHYPQARAAVLDALKLVQKRNGWVNDGQVVAIAKMLDISVADVEGVATVFNRIYLFFFSSRRRHTIWTISSGRYSVRPAAASFRWRIFSILIIRLTKVKHDCPYRTRFIGRPRDSRRSVLGHPHSARH